MFDYTNQLQNTAQNRLMPTNPMMDMQSTNKFSCTPSEYGCIPTPIPSTQNPTMPSPQQMPQQVPQQIVPAAYDSQYLNQFLMTQVGRLVTVEFLIGTNTFIDKSGKLLAVGTNYILLLETNSDDVVACDFYNIKFIKFYL